MYIDTAGHWQLDMGGLATINLPPNSPLDLDEVFKTFNVKPTEIVD